MGRTSLCTFETPRAIERRAGYRKPDERSFAGMLGQTIDEDFLAMR